MTVICADDERLALSLLTSVVKEVLPEADIHSFKTGREVLGFASETQCQIAFLDINLGQSNGIELAYKLKVLNPQINIIFVTGYDEFYREAFDLHASGYILKPVTKEAVQKEIDSLRTPVENIYDTNGLEEIPEVLPVESENTEIRNSARTSVDSEKLVVRTFGNFELFYKGELVKFKRSKSKELLAYLIDRKGSSVQTQELVAVLWEDQTVNHNTRSQLQNLTADIRSTFNELGIKNVFLKGFNSYAIKVENVDCDYYKFLAGDVPAINSFMGEYMNNYSWGEFTLGALSTRSR